MTEQQGILFRALPDVQDVGARVLPTGGIETIMPNQMVPAFPIEDQLNHAFSTEFHPNLNEDRIANAPWVLNFCADADIFGSALDDLAKIQSRTATPIYNHPDAVKRSRRDISAGLLEGLPNLIVPKCIRFRPRHFNDFAATFEKSGFTFPVLVRPAGSQTGRGLVHIANKDQWKLLHGVRWQGLACYMTQFVDYRNADGEFVKIRLLAARGRIAYRGAFFSQQWMIHASKRTPEMVERELPLLQRRDWHALDRLGRAIQDRIGMDHIGIDLGIVDENTFVLFEANSAMTIYQPRMVPEHRRAEYVELLEGIRSDFWASLADFGIGLPNTETNRARAGN